MATTTNPDPSAALVQTPDFPAMGVDGNIPSFIMLISTVDSTDRVQISQMTMVVLSSEHPTKIIFAKHNSKHVLLTFKQEFEDPPLYVSMFYVGQINPQFKNSDDGVVPRGFQLDVRRKFNQHRHWLEVSLWRTILQDPATNPTHMHDQQNFGSEEAPDTFFQAYEKVWREACKVTKWNPKP